METIRQIAERYLDGKSAQTKKIITKAILSDYGDRHIDESLYSEFMSKIKETWQSRLFEDPYRLQRRGVARATGVWISIEDPQRVSFDDTYRDREVDGDWIFFLFKKPTPSDHLVREICFYYDYRFSYPQQWKAILDNSKSEWAPKIIADAEAFMNEKKTEAESLRRREADLLAEQTKENRKEEYLAIREKVLKERKEARERKDRHDNMYKRAQKVVQALNSLYKEILSIERESDELDEGWRGKLPGWHETVTLKAREIAVLSISQTRAREQVEYFTSLDGEWGEDKENENENNQLIYDKPL